MIELKEAFVTSSLDYLKRNNACDKSKENIFRYTLESLYSFTTKSIVILITSAILGTFKITFLTLVLYSILRGFTFGIHASKNLYCWIISMTVYVIFPFLISNYIFPITFIYISYIIGIISILLWAPADTKARPLLNKRKRLVNKIFSLLVAGAFIGMSFILKNSNFNEIITIVLLMNSICMCPLTYYIFKQPYKNYRFYKG